MTPTKEYVGERVTFKDLFSRHDRVEIPIIQRDYAQGRESALEVRSLFLDALHAALKKLPDDPTLPLDLDFVYGSIESQGEAAFCPLDGQQRLTTLFLLHWYLAWADEQTDDFASFVALDGSSRFAYAVRSSSGEFFDSLVRWVPAVRPSEVTSLHTLIENQAWFFQWWKRDPTIVSALTMLEAIHGRFREEKDFYSRIVATSPPCVTFQLLDLDNFGLSDDLYIKMNARGKPLTGFETFKAMVEKHIGEVFPEPDVRKWQGKPVTLKYYFSHQIDTTWAELFWAYRDPKTNLFDGQVMNLIRALAIVTRDPDGTDFEAVLAALSVDHTLSFQRHLEIGSLDKPHIELFVTFLDACSGAPNGIRKHLADGKYFDEDSTFRRVLEKGGTATYADLIQFTAYAESFRLHGLEPDSAQTGDWMRVVRNLTVNSNIARPAEFRRSLRSVLDLLEHSDRILSYLAEDNGKVEGFSVQQIREERIKAALILKSSRWKQAVQEAEQHGYFNGQIEFLLDFSGILAAWDSKSSCDWTVAEDDDYFAKFSNYWEKARLLFSDWGLIPHGDYRTERALLAIGDYTFEYKKNRSLLDDAEGPTSWKRLLRGEQVQQAGHRRGFVKQLLDHIDLKAPLKKSLDALIQNAIIPEEWRRLLAKNPKFIEFCGKRQLRHCSSANVYLLKGERRSGEHVELFSYQLYLGYIAKKFSRGEMGPFREQRYNSVHTDAYQPSIMLNGGKGDSCLGLQIWNNTIQFKVRLFAVSGELSADLKHDLESKAGCSVANDGSVFAEVPLHSIEQSLDKIIEVTSEHVAE